MPTLSKDMMLFIEPILIITCIINSPKEKRHKRESEINRLSKIMPIKIKNQIKLNKKII